jgi:hypothetical protein
MDQESKKLLQQLYARPRDEAALQAVRSRFARQRRFKGLAKVMEWWSKKAPTEEAASEALFEAAEALERGRGDPEKVVELLRSSLEKDRGNAAAALRLEEIYRERGDQERLRELMAGAESRHISLIDELEGVDDASMPPPAASPPAPTAGVAGKVAPPPRPRIRRPPPPRIPPSPPVPDISIQKAPAERKLPAPPVPDISIKKAPAEEARPSEPLPDIPVREAPADETGEAERVSAPSFPPPETGQRPEAGAPPDGFEPQLYDDEEELAGGYREPFTVDEIIEGPERPAAVPGGRARSAPVAEVIRLHRGRMLGSHLLQGLRGKTLGFRDRRAPFRLRLRGEKASLDLREPVEGWIRGASGDTAEQPRELPPQPGRLSLAEGESAEVRHADLVYRIRMFRPPPAPVPSTAQSRAPMARRARIFASCTFIAVAVHGLALTSLALLAALGVSFKVEDRPREEIFAEIRSKPPEERPRKKKPPPRIQRRKRPRPKELPPPERPAQIPRYLRKHLSRISKGRPGDRAQRVISALTSPVRGEGQTLRDVVTNLDAVGGGEKAGAFALGGTLSHLEGIDGVNIAGGGGGELGTLGGEEAVKGVKRLQARHRGSGRGGVRGRVRALSVGSRVSGSLSRGEVLAVINRHMARIQQCYERGLTRKGTMAGRVSFTWTITPTGKVSGLRQVSSTLGDVQVSNCISKVISRMRFPRPKGGSVSITFPFIFRRAQ